MPGEMPKLGFTPQEATDMMRDKPGRALLREEGPVPPVVQAETWQLRPPEVTSLADKMEDALGDLGRTADHLAGECYDGRYGNSRIHLGNVAVSAGPPPVNIRVGGTFAELVDWATLSPTRYERVSTLESRGNRVNQAELRHRLLNKLYQRGTSGTEFGAIIDIAADSIDYVNTAGMLVDLVQLQDTAGNPLDPTDAIQLREAKLVMREAMQLILLEKGPRYATELMKALRNDPANQPTRSIMNAGLLNRYLKKTIKAENTRRNRAGGTALTIQAGTIAPANKRANPDIHYYRTPGTTYNTDLDGIIGRTAPSAPGRPPRYSRVYRHGSADTWLTGIQNEQVRNILRSIRNKKGLKGMAQVVHQLGSLATANTADRVNIINSYMKKDTAGRLTGEVTPLGRILGKDLVFTLNENLNPKSFEFQALMMYRLAEKLEAGSTPAGIDVADWKARLSQLRTACGFEEHPAHPGTYRVKKDNLNMPLAMARLLRLTDGATATDTGVQTLRSEIHGIAKQMVLAQLFRTSQPGAREYFDTYANATDNNDAAQKMANLALGTATGQHGGDMSKREVQRFRAMTNMLNDLDNYFTLIGEPPTRGFSAEQQQQLSDLTAFVNTDPEANPLDHFRGLRGEATVEQALQSEAIEQALLGHQAENTAEDQEIKDILAMSDKEPEGPLAFMKKTWSSLTGFLKTRGPAATVSGTIAILTAVGATASPAVAALVGIAGIGMVVAGIAKTWKAAKKSGGFGNYIRQSFGGVWQLFKERPGLASTVALGSAVASFALRTLWPGWGCLIGTGYDAALLVGGEIVGTVAQNKLREKCKTLAQVYKNQNLAVKNESGVPRNIDMPTLFETMVQRKNDQDVEDPFWSTKHSHYQRLNEWEKKAWETLCEKRTDVQRVRNSAANWMTGVAAAQAGSAVGAIGSLVARVTGFDETLREKVFGGPEEPAAIIEKPKSDVEQKAPPAKVEVEEAPPAEVEAPPIDVSPEATAIMENNSIPMPSEWLKEDLMGEYEFIGTRNLFITNAGGTFGILQGDALRAMLQAGATYSDINSKAGLDLFMRLVAMQRAGTALTPDIVSGALANIGMIAAAA